MNRIELRTEHEAILLHPGKAALLEGGNELLVSDLHIGKPAHFRRHGMAVPSSLQYADLLKLGLLIRGLCPPKVIILGDLFHTGFRPDIELFRKWRDSYPGVDMILVRGNHDRFGKDSGKDTGLTVLDELRIREFRLVHDSARAAPDNAFTISGHMHPAVRVFGKGRQSVKVACFYLSGGSLVMPAFGEFTGKQVITPERGDRIFAVIEDPVEAKVMEVI